MRLAVLFTVLGIVALGFIPVMFAFPSPDWPIWMIALTHSFPILMAAAFFSCAVRTYRHEKRDNRR